jgi:hypothetical protein
VIKKSAARKKPEVFVMPEIAREHFYWSGWPAAMKISETELLLSDYLSDEPSAKAVEEVRLRLQQIERGVPAEDVFPRRKEKPGPKVEPARDEAMAYEFLRLVYVEKVKERDAKSLVCDAFEEHFGKMELSSVEKAVSKWRKAKHLSEDHIRYYARVLRLRFDEGFQERIRASLAERD